MANHSEYEFNTQEIKDLVQNAPTDTKLVITIDFERDTTKPDQKVFVARVMARVKGIDAKGNEVFLGTPTLTLSLVEGCPRPPSCK
jgi:hypothetical protein